MKGLENVLRKKDIMKNTAVFLYDGFFYFLIAEKIHNVCVVFSRNVEDTMG